MDMYPVAVPLNAHASIVQVHLHAQHLTVHSCPAKFIRPANKPAAVEIITYMYNTRIDSY